jgi:hypothetical protein
MTTEVTYKGKRSETILTPEWRGAYPNVHEQSTKRPNGKLRARPVWIMTLCAPKLNPDPVHCANYQMLAKTIMEAVSREPAWNGQFPAGGHWPIQDGDAPLKPKAPIPGQPITQVDPARLAWRNGHWIIEASTSLAPGPRVCVMQGGQMVEIPAKIVHGRTMYKSGDYCHASLHAFTFWNEKFGVNFGLEGVLWTREGEAIGSAGPRSAQAMFGSLAGMAPQPTAATPGAYAPPPGVMMPPAAAPAGYAPPMPQAVPGGMPGAPVGYQPPQPVPGGMPGAYAAPPMPQAVPGVMPGAPAAPQYAPPAQPGMMPPPPAAAPQYAPPPLPPFPGQ